MVKAPKEIDDRLKRDYAHLKCGHRYKVVKPFVDFDDEVHPVGEIWNYLGYSYLPYNSGLTIFAVIKEKLVAIRLCDDPDFQQHIVSELDNHLKETT